jgi:hypothetical protein
VRVTANPFLFAVIDGLVAGETATDRAVHVRLISSDMAAGVVVVQIAVIPSTS